MNAIIIYYSRAGNNYVNGEIKNLKTGNTEIIAQKIAELTQSPTFKIEQTHPYSNDYSECIDEAKRDQRLDVRPELKELPTDLQNYDTIYLGYPNYWGTMPMAMFTLLERINLTGKTIKPFCSHEGNGLGRSIEDIQKLCPNSKVEEGLAIHGAIIEEEKLKKWLGKDENQTESNPQEAQSVKDTQNSNDRSNINENTTVGEVINNPAFAGFGEYIFPINSYTFYEGLKISNINSLLPYHSHINTETTIEVIQYMLEQVESGETIFYDIYSEEEKKQDSSKEDTGLFYFRGKPNAPFAILCAGGGFSYVGSIHEAYPHALELSKQGYNAFVIQYRTNSQEAVEDLARAISYIFQNAEELGVSTTNYSLWGSSAGARMVAYIGTYGVEAFGGDNLAKPGTIVMAYTGHTDYSESDPPTFIVVGENDGIANPATMERRAENLRRVGVDVEFHEYPNLGHGFGLGIGTSAEGWIDLAIDFWQKHMT